MNDENNNAWQTLRELCISHKLTQACTEPEMYEAMAAARQNPETAHGQLLNDEKLKRRDALSNALVAKGLGHFIESTLYSFLEEANWDVADALQIAQLYAAELGGDDVD